MEIDIRKNIINNFKNCDVKEIEESIIYSIKEKEEITLPGLGVFFGLVWSKSSDEERNKILDILKDSLS